jgi:hypothetical protein
MIQSRFHSIPYVYVAIAIVCLLLLLLQATFSVDTNWDTWAYHNPFMARIWQIVTEEQFRMPLLLEDRFDGFPLAAEFIQGLFWKITGRVEAINLLSFFSLMGYIIFLWGYLKIPFYLSEIALLAVPLIQIHVTSSYIDLFSNICLSIFLISGFLVSTRKGSLNVINLILLLLTGILVGNSKFQLIPTLMVGYFCLLIRIISIRDQQYFNRLPRPFLLGILLLGTFLSLGTALKNLYLHANPFYPVAVSLGFLQFNGPEPQYSQIPEYMKNWPRTVQWILSITEVDFLIRKTWQGEFSEFMYTIDMVSGDEFLDGVSVGGRTGGYFGPYVIFHLMLMTYFAIRSIRDHLKKATPLILWFQPQNDRGEISTLSILGVFVLLSLFSSFLPQSLELRYYFYWVIILITINLYFATHLPSIFSVKLVSFICTVFLILVLVITRFHFIRPQFFSYEKLQAAFIDQNTLMEVENATQTVCLVGYQPFAFLYAAPFHGGEHTLNDGYNNPKVNCEVGDQVLTRPA